MRFKRQKALFTVLLLSLFLNNSYGIGLFPKNTSKISQNSINELPPFLKKRLLELETKNDNRLAIYQGNYPLSDEIVESYRSKLSKEDFGKFEEFYFSYLYMNTQKVFLDNVDSKNLTDRARGSTRYNKDGEYSIDGVINAHKFLSNKRFSELTTSDLLNAHKVLLSKESISRRHEKHPKNSEGTKDGNLGKFRWQSMFWKFGGDLNTGCADIRMPFHDYATNSSPASLNDVHDYNPYVSKYVNFVYYVTLSQWRDFEERLLPSTISLIEKTEEELTSKGISFDNHFGKTALDVLPNKHNTVNGRYVYRKFVHDLITSLMVDIRDELDNAKTNDDIIMVGAKFYRDFISIHPFINGNGRMARLLLSKLFNDYNIPTPMMIMPHLDVTFGYMDLFHVIKDSITLSNYFHQSLKYALGHNISYAMAAPMTTLADLWENLPTSSEVFMTWAYSQQYENKLFSTLLKNFDNFTKNFGRAKLALPSYYSGFKKESTDSSTFMKKRANNYFKNRYISKVIFNPKKHNNKKLLSYFRSKKDLSNEKLDETFHNFNVLITKEMDPSELLKGDLLNNISHENMEIYTGKNPPCSAGNPSYIQIITHLPFYGTLTHNNDVSVIGGIDPESIVEVHKCETSKSKASLTVLRRTNFSTVKIKKQLGNSKIYEEDIKL